MRNRLILLISAFLLLATGICTGQSPDGRLRTVVIDPGHGGKDPGTVYGSHKEKDINLAVGILLGEMIQREMPGVEVVYTRKTDDFVDLDARGAIANRAKADFFISIHVNAVDRKTNVPSGALTLIMGTEHMERNLDQAMKENQVIVYEQDYTTKYEEYLSGSSEMFIIYSLTQYVNIEQSINFANILQQYYKTDTPMPDKGIRRQKLLVLWYTTMPGVLTELGFLNNEHDRKALTSAKGQKQMAAALFSALRDYKAQVDAKAKPLQVEQKSSGTAGGGVGSGGGGNRTGNTVEQKGSGTAVAVHNVGAQDVPTPGRATTERESSNTTPAPTASPAASSTTVPASGAAPAPAAGKSEIVYRVQILSSMKRIPSGSSEMKEYRGQAMEKYDGTRYRYYVGECRTYAEALELQARVRKAFPDAFAVAFSGEKSITVPEARKLTDGQPPSATI